MINVNVHWNDDVEELLKKASRTHYFLVQLKRAQVPSGDLVAYYCACIRSSLDYAYSVFHYASPKYLQAELERVQKRVLSCISQEFLTRTLQVSPVSTALESIKNK